MPITVNKQMFACKYCKNEYYDVAGAEGCESRCEKRAQDQQDHETFFKLHKPLYKVGDVLKIDSNFMRFKVNSYFRVREIDKSEPWVRPPYFTYEGAIGSDDEDGYYPDSLASIPESQVKLVMTSEEYEAACDEIERQLPASTSYHEISVCGYKPAIEVRLLFDVKGK